MSDQEELQQIYDIIEEAKAEGEMCEMFFLDEYPEIEGYCNHLRNIGYKVEFSFSDDDPGYVKGWLVSWEEK